MKVVTIDADGMLSDTGEILPDTELLVNRCSSCHQVVCTVPGCEKAGRALGRLLAKLPPPRMKTEAEIEAARVRSHKK